MKKSRRGIADVQSHGPSPLRCPAAPQDSTCLGMTPPSPGDGGGHRVGEFKGETGDAQLSSSSPPTQFSGKRSVWEAHTLQSLSRTEDMKWQVPWDQNSFHQSYSDAWM